MKKLIESFIKNVAENAPHRIINEFNVQFYLGVDLLISNFEVEMEKNLSAKCCKKSYPDILCKKNGNRYGIEAKVKLMKDGKSDGGIPKSMKGMKEDVEFLQQLVTKSGTEITRGYAIAITNDPSMYDGMKKPECDENNKELYHSFRNENGKVKLIGYEADWIKAGDYHYYVMEVVRLSAADTPHSCIE